MKRLHTPLCDLLDIEFPILQAGMGRSRGSSTTPRLVAAVSEAGGMGCLGATGLEPEEIADAIREIRSITDKPFGVDLLLPANVAEADVPRADVRQLIRRDYADHWQMARGLYELHGLDVAVEHDQPYAVSPTLGRRQVEVVLEERVPVFVAALGDPGWLVPRAHDIGIKVMGIAGSVRHAERQRAAGVDAVIAQGAEAGGHTGTIGTFPLIPQVADAVAPISTIAAGGIADGRGMVAALALGAHGVWCGTAFLFSEEAHLYPTQHEQLAAASSRQLVASRSYTGKPSRVMENEITRAWSESELEPLPMPLQMVLMDDFAAAAESAGRYELMQNAGGQIAGMLSERAPARAILQRMVAEAQETLDLLSRTSLDGA